MLKVFRVVGILHRKIIANKIGIAVNDDCVKSLKYRFDIGDKCITLFSNQIDKTLNYSTKVFVNDIICFNYNAKVFVNDILSNNNS